MTGTKVTLGSLIAFMRDAVIMRVETLDPKAKHHYYCECAFCGGTNAAREHYKNSSSTVQHTEDCPLVIHAARLDALEAEPLNDHSTGQGTP